MKRRIVRPIAAVVGGLVALTLAGCASSDESAVREAVSEYLDEVGERDYKSACGFLDDAARRQLGGDCATALQRRYANLSTSVRNDLDDIEVDDVSIDGSTARVTDDEIEVEETVTRRGKDGKKKKQTRTHTAPDVSSGNGFTLRKSGDDWRITAGV